MTKAIAVIGANYGDEGKGATTHHVASQRGIKDVVRFNGGSQAGHTVCVPGHRHVFQNYGSASFLGATTWYTKDVLVNPMYAFSEWETLTKLGVGPLLIRVPPEGIVVSPWDIAINQFLEVGRGTNRHGSCGHGINESVSRHLHPEGPKLVVKDLLDETRLNHYFKEGQNWFKARLKEEKEKGSFASLQETELQYLSSDAVLAEIASKFLVYSSAFFRTAVCVEEGIASKPEGPYALFEGAQGLLLDQEDADHFPHVTRSSTGLKNVLAACDNWGMELSEVYYCTRPYLTRHGQGPILKGLPCGDLWDLGEDRTNRSNKFQGSVRFAHLDWGMLNARIAKDLAQCKTKPEVQLSVICADQIHNQEKYDFYWNGEKTMEFDATDSDEILAYASVMTGLTITTFDGRKGNL